MDYRKFSIGLGWFSIALGAVELVAGRRIARALDNDNAGTVRAFGLREIGSGIALLRAPEQSSRVAARVVGDVLDMGTLALAARNSPKNKLVWGALGFVAGALIVDALVTRGLAGQESAAA